MKATHQLVKDDPYLYFGRCSARTAANAILTEKSADVTCKKCLLALANKYSWDILTDVQRALLHGEVLRGRRVTTAKEG